MGLLRFLFGLMGLSPDSDQTREFDRMDEDQFEDLRMMQRQEEWDESMKRDDED